MPSQLFAHPCCPAECPGNTWVRWDLEKTLTFGTHPVLLPPLLTLAEVKELVSEALAFTEHQAAFVGLRLWTLNRRPLLEIGSFGQDQVRFVPHLALDLLKHTVYWVPNEIEQFERVRSPRVRPVLTCPALMKIGTVCAYLVNLVNNRADAWESKLAQCPLLREKAQVWDAEGPEGLARFETAWQARHEQ